MPRYYFHIRRHEDVIEDREGVELPSDREAMDEAIKAAREMLSERILKGETVDGDEFDVRDETGTELFSIRFRDVLRFE